MSVQLDENQIEVLHRMKNGCILKGKVGTGKSRTALAWYYIQCGGKFFPQLRPMIKPLDLYIITTAKKRDDMDWETECLPFLITKNRYPDLTIKIDSWNNIQKYKDIKNAFFIFDEQRAIGDGKWSKAFIRIAAHNAWIMLSATPGDNWKDYIPVFIANGYYRNRTQFLYEHAVYARYSPKKSWVVGYRNEALLMKYKHSIVIPMKSVSRTQKEIVSRITQYDKDIYRQVLRNRWNVWKDEPIVNAPELCHCLRRVANEDPTRGKEVLDILTLHPKAIIFYNYDYELDILKNLPYEEGTVIREWNGHRHEVIPNNDRWVYLVQYTAGSEGWNCVTTDTMIFYSQNYSYKIMVQAAGRIDRRNTPFNRLYYYHLKSDSPIDGAITIALRKKKDFNENDYVKGMPWEEEDRNSKSQKAKQSK